MISGTIHRLSGHDGLADFRFACKTIANILSVRRLPGGRFPMRRVTEKVRSGDPTLKELQEWYPRAVKLARGL